MVQRTTMTEPSEAMKAAARIIELLFELLYFDDLANRDDRRKAAEDVRPIIERLLDERDAEIERLILEIKTCPLIHTACGACGISIAEDGTCGCGDNHHPIGRIQHCIRSKQQEEIERLKHQLDEAQEYLVELRGEWSWRKNEPRNRNKKRYDELDSFIEQLAEATNQRESKREELFQLGDSANDSAGEPTVVEPPYHCSRCGVGLFESGDLRNGLCLNCWSQDDPWAV